VGVGVEGDGYAGVAQEFLDVLGMLACHEEYCSAGVAEEEGLGRPRRLVPLVVVPVRVGKMRSLSCQSGPAASGSVPGALCGTESRTTTRQVRARTVASE
jgi:hypothetical protein